MSPPSPNPISVFKWEDSSALEHSCWACPTKSNSPKAIHTCYGIHSIPCVAYHPTMHAIGTSHRCSGCIASREMHDSRHREIAELVATYHMPEFILEPPPTGRRPLRERSTNMQLRNWVQQEEDTSDDDYAADENIENASNHDTASTTTSDSSSVLKLTKSEQRERKRAVKAEKSVKKAARNEARHVVQVTAEDVHRIGIILHGEKEAIETHPLATDKTIEDVIARNLGFVKQIQCHKEALLETVRIGRREEQERRRSKRRVSQGEEDTETKAVIDAILVKLGIDVGGTPCVRKSKPATRQNTTPNKQDHKKGGKNEKDVIVIKLREAIKDDLEKHENDLRQTYIRAGGFFRYAGKAVFERMTEVAKSIDLQTGEEWDKKRKREAKLALEDRRQEDVHDNNE